MADELKEEKAMSDWREISTARRAKIESRVVLIGWEGTGLVMPAQWRLHPEYEREKVPSWVGFDGKPGYTPTHWQPTPPPPRS